MLKYYFDCRYCGNSWKDYFYGTPSKSDLYCKNCKSKNDMIRVKRDTGQADSFGYDDKDTVDAYIDSEKKD